MYFYFKEQSSGKYVVARFDAASQSNKVESRKATAVLARRRVNYLNGGPVPKGVSAPATRSTRF